MCNVYYLLIGLSAFAQQRLACIPCANLSYVDLSLTCPLPEFFLR